MANLKAVIPVAGLGMHMLPATKAIPKEMLPIVDKPMIQYIVDEIVAAGIKEIVLVTHSSKNAVENHFDTSYELEALLEQRVKRQLLALTADSQTQLAQADNLAVVSLSDELPQSYVLADSPVDTIYLSELSPAALKRRTEMKLE